MLMRSPRTAWFYKEYTPHISRKAYVAPTASVIGPIEIGEYVMVAPGASLRGDEGGKFYIDSRSNIQDNVILHGLKAKMVQVEGESYSIYISKEVSCAHGSIIHGPVFIGENTFVGFNSIVHSSNIGANCFIGHGARVIGVTITDGKYIPHGAIVTNSEAVAALNEVPEIHKEFNREVVEVNVELAIGYNKPRTIPIQRRSLRQRRA
jgi:carbonic anhydrase/acetyltransferase-like protein (isoleucine patch superfamily)